MEHPFDDAVIISSTLILTSFPMGLDLSTILYTSSNASYSDKRCLLYTSPSPRDAHESRMPSSA